MISQNNITLLHRASGRIAVNAKKVDGSFPLISFSAYSALKNGDAVCQGFAALLYRLCLKCGIDSRIVTSERMNHAYNILRLDGLYYYADTTWDYTRYPGNYDYFLRGSVNWVKDIPSSHELGDEFEDTAFAAAYPVSPADYIPAGDMNGDRTVGEADVLFFDGLRQDARPRRDAAVQRRYDRRRQHQQRRYPAADEIREGCQCGVTDKKDFSAYPEESFFNGNMTKG